ncbi:MAG: hypothetical protein ABIY90_17525 [Puia sp.]
MEKKTRVIGGNLFQIDNQRDGNPGYFSSRSDPEGPGSRNEVPALRA